MTELPPEVVEARRVLRQVTAAPFSMARVYERVLDERRGRRGHKRTRMAALVFCVAASSSAMALGYRWTREQQSVATQAQVPVLSSASRRPLARSQRGIGSKPEQAFDAESSRASGSGENASGSPKPVTRDTRDARDGDVRSASGGPAVSSGARQRVLSSNVARRTSPQQAELAQNSELSQQVHDYQDAVSVIHRNPRLALEKLRAYRRKWPRSAIGEEADLREIEALLALGRRGEAAHAARAFVRGYPSSARTPEMQRIADSVPSSARFD